MAAATTIEIETVTGERLKARTTWRALSVMFEAYPDLREKYFKALTFGHEGDLLLLAELLYVPYVCNLIIDNDYKIPEVIPQMEFLETITQEPTKILDAWTKINFPK